MVFITSYEKDNVTKYLSLWAEEIYKYAEEIGIKPVHFKDGRKDSVATKDNVTNYLKKKKPRFVFFNGHGNEQNICGHKDQPIISLNDNEYLLKNKIVYAVACDCGKELGKSIVLKGEAKSFIGYKRKFCVPTTNDRVCNPIKDNLPQAIKEVSNSIPKAIIKGKNVGQALIDAQISWAKWNDFFQRQKPSDKTETILWVLFNNFTALCTFGDNDCSISY